MPTDKTPNAPSADPSIHADVLAGLLDAVSTLAVAKGHIPTVNAVKRLHDQLHGVQPPAPPAPPLPAARTRVVQRPDGSWLQQESVAADGTATWSDVGRANANDAPGTPQVGEHQRRVLGPLAPR